VGTVIARLLTVQASLQSNDDDGSFETFALGVPRDFELQSPVGVVPNDGLISKIVVGWRAKDPQGNGDVLKVGLRSGGLRQYGQEQVLDATGYQPPAGGGEFQDEFETDALDGQPWTYAKLLAMTAPGSGFTALATQVFSSPDPRISYAYVDVHVVTPPGHVSANPQQSAPGAAPQPAAPEGTPVGQAPKGGPS
jgi:hypothetical protein